MKKIASLLILAMGICCFAGCSSEGTKASNTDEVKNGYMGGCFEATLGEVFEMTIPGGKWDGGETDDGKKIVEYNADDGKTRIQFTLTDANHFKASAIKTEAGSPQSNEEAGRYIYGQYITYFGSKYPDKAAADFMGDEPFEDILQGVTASYSAKAKNPVDISEYLDKKPDDLKAVLEIKADSDDISYTGDGFTVMYDDDGIYSVDLNESRVATLFKINAHMSYDAAKEKIADEFTFTYADDTAGDSGTFKDGYRKNGTDDMLAITYSADGYVTNVMYIKDAWAGL